MSFKTILAGVIMIAAGVAKMGWPEIVPFIEGDATLLIGTGFGLIFMRLGIAKNGLGK